MMNIEYLQTYISVYENRSITKAGEELFLSKQTVLYHISQLEKIFKESLFVRNHSGCEPTVKGDSVYKYAVRIVDVYKKMMEDNVETNTIRVGIDSRILSDVAFKTINKLKKEFDVENTVFLTLKDLTSGMEKNEIDMFFCHDEGLVSYPFYRLMDDSIYLICSENSDYAGEEEISINEIKEVTVYYSEDDGGFLCNILEPLKNTCRFEKQTSEVVVGNNIYENKGIAFIHELNLKEFPKKSFLRYIRISDYKQPFGISYRSSEKTDELLKVLKTIVKGKIRAE